MSNSSVPRPLADADIEAVTGGTGPTLSGIGNAPLFDGTSSHILNPVGVDPLGQGWMSAQGPGTVLTAEGAGPGGEIADNPFPTGG